VTAAPGGDWSVDRRTGTVEALHGSWPPPGERHRRVVGVCTVVGPATVVLGSTQNRDTIDPARVARQGVEVVRRRSGGGAVLVGPAAQVWLDVWLPRHDALWDDDVLRSSWWLGETWVRALEGLGASPLAVHRRSAARTEWSDVVCFAGLGPGEVTAGSAKVVGLAQRRTRDGARLHSMAPLVWDPAPLVDLLALDDAQARRASVALEGVATGVRAVVDRWRGEDDEAVVLAVEDALLTAMP
jgi:lipoate-protein ligase A